eukprot:TRINITY_DN3489_c0_g1_i8.p1 TRINITY_DN3489_c0_g1~~TRINITY_DN3489_c0_g1_i8.p1  ORF type:complete len:184 (-),score=22.69 TRINITY_DN3489_c0_g1_i8:333-884(-)
MEVGVVIRSVAVGMHLLINDSSDTLVKKLMEAVATLDTITQGFIDQGYIVQTKRIMCNSFEEWVDMNEPESSIFARIFELETFLHSTDVFAINIGPSRCQHSSKLIPHLLKNSKYIVTSTEMNISDLGIVDHELCLAAARIITNLGDLNFRYCASANMVDCCPFFSGWLSKIWIWVLCRVGMQ